MRTVAQIIQNYAGQDVPCVVLSVDGSPARKYIFNVPETTQRFVGEHRINFARGSIIFLTRLDARTISGLPGLMCTLCGGGDRAEGTKIYGPRGTVEFFNEISYLMNFNQAPYAIQNLSGEDAEKKTVYGLRGEENIHKAFALPEFKNHIFHLNEIIAKHFSSEKDKN